MFNFIGIIKSLFNFGCINIYWWLFVNIFIFGLFGSGKSMYLRIIMEKYGFVYILLGDFIRREIERKFFFGREMEVYFSRGDFILDIIVNILIILKFCC